MTTGIIRRQLKSMRPDSILRVVGWALIIVGALAGLLAPLEVYSFYFFLEGGPFYFEGFGPGSIVFASIASQIACYYLIAAVAMALGFGFLKRRCWAGILMRTILRLWLALGVPVVVGGLFALGQKNPSLLTAAVALAACVFIYPVLPALLLWIDMRGFFNRYFGARDDWRNWSERIPPAVLDLSAALACLILALHIPLLLHGAFPFFGTWLTGLHGFLSLIGTMGVLAILCWAVLTQRSWAGISTMIVLGLLSLSLITTLARYDFGELLAALEVPVFERERLVNVPLQGVHLAAFSAIPTAGVLILVARARITLTRAFHKESESHP